MMQSVRDKNYFVWLVFLSFGFCSLSPWNMLLNTIPFFDEKLNKTGCVQDKSESIISVVTISVMIPMFLVNCITPFLYKISPIKKVGIGLSGLFTLSFAILFVIQMDNFYIPFIIIVVCTSCFFSLLQSSLFAMANNFPMIYTPPIIIGQGLSGILTVLYLEHLTRNGESPSIILFYYISGLFIIILTLSGYWKLFHNTFFLFFNEAILPEKTIRELLYTNDFTKKNLLYFLTIWLSLTTTLSVFPTILFEVRVGGVRLAQYILLCYNISDLVGRFIVCIYSAIGQNPFNLLKITALRIVVAIVFLFCDIESKKKDTNTYKRHIFLYPSHSFWSFEWIHYKFMFHVGFQ